MKEKLVQVWTELTADKKKASILGALLGLALILGVRALLVGGKAPAPAPAAPASAGAAPTGTSGMAQPAPDSPGAGATALGSSSLDLRPPMRFGSVGGVQRDVFRLNPAFFPDVQPAAQEGALEGANSTPGSADSASEEGLSPQALAQRRVQADAARLRLRSIMLGPNPVAIVESDVEGAIKATVLRPGESIAGFRVVAVKEDGVTLERGGIEVTLTPEHKK